MATNCSTRAQVAYSRLRHLHAAATYRLSLQLLQGYTVHVLPHKPINFCMQNVGGTRVVYRGPSVDPEDV